MANPINNNTPWNFQIDLNPQPQTASASLVQRFDDFKRDKKPPGCHTQQLLAVAECDKAECDKEKARLSSGNKWKKLLLPETIDNALKLAQTLQGLPLGGGAVPFKDELRQDINTVLDPFAEAKSRFRDFYVLQKEDITIAHFFGRVTKAVRSKDRRLGDALKVWSKDNNAADNVALKKLCDAEAGLVLAHWGCGEHLTIVTERSPCLVCCAAISAVPSVTVLYDGYYDEDDLFGVAFRSTGANIVTVRDRQHWFTGSAPQQRLLAPLAPLALATSAPGGASAAPAPQQGDPAPGGASAAPAPQQGDPAPGGASAAPAPQQGGGGPAP
jgi:hypothetical protein